MTEATSIEDDAPEAASLQRQLLIRAGMAAGLIVVLLAGLAVYDRMNRVVVPPPAAPSTQVPAAPETVAGAGSATAGTSVADESLRPEIPSEPEHTSAPELRRGAPRLVLGGELPPPHAARPPSGTPAAELPAAAGKGYLVQLGVFASLENAEGLRARLEGLGIPARLESRVVVGPFPDQAAARAAQARLREAGQNAGLIVPPRR